MFLRVYSKTFGLVVTSIGTLRDTGHTWVIFTVCVLPINTGHQSIVGPGSNFISCTMTLCCICIMKTNHNFISSLIDTKINWMREILKYHVTLLKGKSRQKCPGLHSIGSPSKKMILECFLPEQN